jgi:D-alanyl-D-alanine carboxypeptidase/D-alanyl-D-alanine-endopeptidase (penicillin-binding protein 4)
MRERMRAQRPGGDDLPPPPRRPAERLKERRVPSWVTPAILGTVAVLAAAGAFLLDRDPSSAAVGAPEPVTPVLSARRVPEVLAAPVANRRLQADLQGWMTNSPGTSCLEVQAGSDVLFAQNTDAQLTGASTQKLLTATAALLELGPDARLDTVASAAAPPVNGEIAGDLYVVGNGDPILTTPDYAKQLYRDRQPSLATDPAVLADQIKAAGVTHVKGSIVGDGSRYDTERYNAAWPPRYRDQPGIIGHLGALMINDGFTEFPQTFSPNSRVASSDPALHAAEKLTALLRERGVQVDGAPKSGQAPQRATLTTVATLQSATVEQIVGEMLVESDNDTAEMLLKELGQRESGIGSYAAGAAAVTKILNEAGVPLGNATIVDGSGLSTQNRMSCQLLMTLITRPETGPMLVEHAAVAGETGTLAELFKGTPAAGRIHAKTGTLNTVVALTGRADPTRGGSLMFSYIANLPEPQQFGSGKDDELRTGLADILVGYPRGIDVDALLPAPLAGG